MFAGAVVLGLVFNNKGAWKAGNKHHLSFPSKKFIQAVGGVQSLRIEDEICVCFCRPVCPSSEMTRQEPALIASMLILAYLWLAQRPGSSNAQSPLLW